MNTRQNYFILCDTWSCKKKALMCCQYLFGSQIFMSLVLLFYNSLLKSIIKNVLWQRCKNIPRNQYCFVPRIFILLLLLSYDSLYWKLLLCTMQGTNYSHVVLHRYDRGPYRFATSIFSLSLFAQCWVVSDIFHNAIEAKWNFNQHPG